MPPLAALVCLIFVLFLHFLPGDCGELAVRSTVAPSRDKALRAQHMCKELKPHHICSALQCNRCHELRMKLAPRAPNGTSAARLVVGWLADCNCEGNDIGAAFEAYATRACDIASPP